MQIVMPKLGLTMTEGTLTQWHKAEGDEVKQGEILFEFESEKSVLEFECPANGTLTQRLVAEGQTVPCGTAVAMLETTPTEQNASGRERGSRGAREQGGKESAAIKLRHPDDQPSPLPRRTHMRQLKQPKTFSVATRPSSIPPARGEVGSSPLQGEVGRGSNVAKIQPQSLKLTRMPRRIPAPWPTPATPAAKRQARELGVDLSAINGRGPQGRIHVADVEAVAQAATSAPAREAITPMAKRIASDLDIEWRQISGSGPGGRVVKQDILQAASPQMETAANTASTKVQPLAGVRGVIARRMSESAFTAPHVTLFTEADASALVEARGQLNAELSGSVELAGSVELSGSVEQVRPIKISYNALMVAILARLLRDYPELNAAVIEDEIHYYDDVNIALAVDTERGLLVPVIRNADHLNLVSIQQTGDELIQRALSGRSLPDDLTGGTFTLTNLGMFDIDGFTPIINQPQAAILGVGRIVPKPVVGSDNEIVVRRMMTLSLSFDHRIVDGGPAARFLQRVKQLIERPFALLIPL